MLDADGGFGPFVVESGAHYECVLSAPDTDVQHHLYLQPYVRDSHLVRLLSSGPDGDTRVNTNVGDDHAALIAIRMREWYAVDDPDGDGDERDVLEILDAARRSESTRSSTSSGTARSGFTSTTTPRRPGGRHASRCPTSPTQPFQNGVDVFIPAAEPPNGDDHGDEHPAR